MKVRPVLWGSDCHGACEGNATAGSLTCDECGSTDTTPLWTFELADDLELED
jgi:hypothetical protein